MSDRDIQRMIEEALAEADEPRSRRPLPHAQHILDQYVRLCDSDLPTADPSAEVALPVAPAPGPGAPGRARPLARIVRKAIGRVKGSGRR